MDKPLVSVVIPFKATNEQHIDWLIDAILSVQSQTYENWEVSICNDHSETNLDLLKAFLKTLPRERLVTRTSRGKGVCSARNYAVSMSHGELIMPLDADDLLPNDSLETLVDGWFSGGKARGIVYGDVEMFGPDWSRIFEAGEYDYVKLLTKIFMPVGSLHSRTSWELVGGWNTAMEGGLEDWEYWIDLGEKGICGYYVPRVVYRYRKQTGGRLDRLKSSSENHAEAMKKMRDLHRDVYAGRYPMACCGKTSSASTKTVRVSPAKRYSDLGEGMVRIAYVGNRSGSFFISGQSTGTKYKVPGSNKLLTDTNMIAGVHQEDVDHLLQMEGGHAFRIVD